MRLLTVKCFLWSLLFQFLNFFRSLQDLKCMFSSRGETCMVFYHKRFVISTIVVASKDGRTIAFYHFYLCISLLSQEYLTQTFTLLDCLQSPYLHTGNKKRAKWAQSTRGVGAHPLRSQVFRFAVTSSFLFCPRVQPSKKYDQHKFSCAHSLICIVNKRTDTWSFEVLSALPSSRRRPARYSSVQHLKTSHRFFILLFPFQRILRRISLSQVYDCKK